MIHDPFGRRSSHHSESQQLTFTNKRGYNRTPSTVTHKLRWGLGSSCLVKCRSSNCHTAAFLKSRIMCNVKGSLSFTEANWHLQMMGKLLPRVRHTFGVNERRKKQLQKGAHKCRQGILLVLKEGATLESFRRLQSLCT